MGGMGEGDGVHVDVSTPDSLVDYISY
jgi:hypothetical protein